MFNSFTLEPVPTGDLDPSRVELHKEVAERNAKILYRGTRVSSYADPAARGNFRLDCETVAHYARSMLPD